jgi:DNA polymerase-3 subunit alpha
MDKCIEHGRWSNDPIYVARFKKEVDVIMKNDTLNFLPYFLMYEDICSYARSQGILQGIGRGSAGGSLISYYLKIIHINPIERDLPFERFLSHARIRAGSFPDIDCDFGDRSPILRYLEKKYGLGFAQICTYSKMKTKNAISDAMFALYGTNREEPNLKAIKELIPDSPQGVDEYDFLYGYTDKEETYHPGLVEISEEVANFFLMYPAVEEMVKRLIGVVRGVSRHASGYIISTLDLSQSRIPTMKMLDRNTGEMLSVTQFEASMCEGCGLVKADILGVTTIQAVSDCIRLVKQNTGIDYLEEDDRGVALVYRLPENKAVYRDFYNKDTDSSFQFNTSLIKGYIRQFAPTDREHLSAMTALCRPGALDAPFVNDEISLDDGVTAAQYYMDVRNGARKLSYLHPDLALCTTNGVFVYQEEVMKFLVEIVGYSLEESDQIRAAIAKKKHEVMMATFSRIREAASLRGWTEEQANTICSQIQAFARYSFNRSHSACYGDTGYITMYMKNQHKHEWWTSILNVTNESAGSKKEEKLRHFMTLLGDIVTAPSLEIPSKNFIIKDDKIIAPLSVLKNVGETAIEELVSKGPFYSLQDYIARVAHNKCNIGVFSAILKGRAADCFMNKDLPYADARKKLMEDYMAIRKIKKDKGFKEDMYILDPINIFLMEKDTNKCFNKSLFTDFAIRSVVESHLDEMEHTGGKNIPFFRGVAGGDKVPVANSIRTAHNMIKNDYEGDIGLVLLFESSEHKKGISKKSGRPWNMVKAALTDGFSMVECIWWDKKQALRWPKNSIVYVRGTVSEGWGGKLNITVKEMERVE